MHSVHSSYSVMLIQHLPLLVAESRYYHNARAQIENVNKESDAFLPKFNNIHAKWQTIQQI